MLCPWCKFFQTSQDVETEKIAKVVKTLFGSVQDLITLFPEHRPGDELSCENENLQSCLVQIAVIAGVTIGDSGGARLHALAKSL